MKKLKKCLLIILLTFHLCACGSQPLPGQPTPSPQAGASLSGQSTEILSGTYLVVNARTTEYSAVKEYLNFLLSYENQYTLVHPVRKDVFENRLTRDPVSGMYYMPLTLDNSNSAQIQPKPNGDSYLEEYLAFLESAKPADNSHPAVWDIIYQELNTYLNSGKNARDTAAVIQSRVQLYLDENAS